METVLKNIDLMSKEIKDSLTHFMLNHSAIEPRGRGQEEVYCSCPEGDRYYSDLGNVGRKMQVYLTEAYKLYFSTLHSVMEDQPEDVLSKLSKANVVVTRTIEHRLTWAASSRQALDLAMKALDDQLNLLKDVHGTTN